MVLGRVLGTRPLPWVPSEYGRAATTGVIGVARISEIGRRLGGEGAARHCCAGSRCRRELTTRRRAVARGAAAISRSPSDFNDHADGHGVAPRPHAW